MLPLPLRKDSIRLADWLELHALSAGDSNVSVGDLERVLSREASDTSDREAPYRQAREAVGEITQRATAAGNAYPFTLSGNLITARPNAQIDHEPYVFMLCLSYFGWTAKKNSTYKPRRWFEELSQIAANAYLPGESALLSPPRKVLPASFRGAIDRLCVLAKEGGGWKPQPIGWNRKGVGLAPQDDAVDVIAWRHFPDQLPGKLLLFAQCASGDNWTTKLNELQPIPFCSQWMRDPPPSMVLKAMFIPHRVSRERWDYSTRQAGILFDRTRIANLIPVGTALPGGARLRQWCRLEVGKASSTAPA